MQFLTLKVFWPEKKGQKKCPNPISRKNFLKRKSRD
jgi:hypothetical protein